MLWSYRLCRFNFNVATIHRTWDNSWFVPDAFLPVCVCVCVRVYVLGVSAQYNALLALCRMNKENLVAILDADAKHADVD